MNSVSRSNSDGVPTPISRPAILLDNTKFCGWSFWKIDSESRALQGDCEITWFVDECEEFLSLEAFNGKFGRGDALEQTEPRAAQFMHCWLNSADEHRIFRDLWSIWDLIQDRFRCSQINGRIAYLHSVHAIRRIITVPV